MAKAVHQSNQASVVLTTPYNFIPLNEQIVCPHWANCISHDVPFSDGKSGVLDLQIEARSPIFVRNSVARSVASEDEKKSLGSHFSKFGEKYFIPGTSIKGAIRNVLEILSFGNISANTGNDRYAMRDLHFPPYTQMFNTQTVYGGWLKKKTDNYELHSICVPTKVLQNKIDDFFGTNHFEQFDPQHFQNKDNWKSAEKKYMLFSQNNLQTKIDGEEGTFVFTGQPTSRDKTNSKQNEFFFPKTDERLNIGEKIYKDFQFAYFEHDTNRQSDDYKYWMRKLKAGIDVPVFFHKDMGQVASMGLSYMYKLPFTYSINQSIRAFQNNKCNGPDMAQCIFGYTNDESTDEITNALKGRVIFGHAFAIGEVNNEMEKQEVLNSPKASYYPTYIRQQVDSSGKIQTDNYKTLFDKDAVIAGWKRYPIHGDGIKRNSAPLVNGRENQKLLTSFTPLSTGTVFNCTIHYHNLRVIELGALLSALTFHNTTDSFHTFGMAKPLGYGKVKLIVSGITEEEKISSLQAFEAYMNACLSHTTPAWHNSEQVTELLTIATEQRNQSGTRSELIYMKDVKNFAKAKKNKLALDKYSNLGNGVKSKIAAVLIGPKDITVAKSQIKNEQKQMRCRPEDKAQINTNKELLKAEFETRKAALIQKIRARRRAAEEAERQKEKDVQQRAREQKERQDKELAALKKAQEAEQAKFIGLNLDAIDVTKRDAYELVKKEVEKYISQINDNQKFDRLKKQPGQSLISEKDSTVLSATLLQIFTNLKKADKEKWLDASAKNAFRKKLLEYMSEAEVNNVIQNFRNVV